MHAFADLDDGLFKIGDCRLKTWEESQGINFCSQLKSTAYELLPLSNTTELQTLSVEGYTSMHFLDTQSLHWAGHYTKSWAKKKSADIDHGTDLFVYRAGKPGLNLVVIDVGRQRLPFGVVWPDTDGIYYPFRPYQFYFDPASGLNLTVRDLGRITWEIGIAAEKSATEEQAKNPEANEASMRISLDTTSEFGTRWVLSMGGKENGKRTVGIALIHRAKERSLSQFEWIRFQDHPDGKSSEFQQIFRLLLSAPRNDYASFKFNFESQRNLYRQYGIIYSYAFNPFSEIDSSFLYRRLDKNAKEDFYLILGMNFHA